MKNIIFIASNYPPRIGGPATTVPILAKSLSKEFNISVIAFREKNTKRYEHKEFELFRSPSFFAFGFSNPFSVFIRTILMSIYSKKIAYSKKTTLIHAHDTHISAVSALFCKFTSIRKINVVVKYAGDLVLEFSGLNNSQTMRIEDLFAKPTLKQKILIKVQKKIFNMSNFIHVQNEYQQNILINYYNINPKKIIIIPNPIDLNKFKKLKTNLKSKKGFTLLAVSRLVPWKGIETIINSMPAVLKEMPHCTLRVVGEGKEEYVNKLKDLVNQLDLTKKVVFTGKRIGNALIAEYSNSNLFVQASLYEPFGITVIEALASNKPVVVSRAGGLPELVQTNKTGYLFDAGNKKDLSKKVILAHKNILKLNKTNKQNTIKQYSLEKISRRLIEFYKKL
jgi:glycosyltransferase involved in cell wall biosynthesis